MPTTRKIIGGRVRSLRRSKGWSMEELSERAQVQFSTVSRIERGLQEPSISTLEKLAATLGVSLVALIPNDDGRRASAAELRGVMERLAEMPLDRFYAVHAVVVALSS